MESWLLGHFEIVNGPYPNATWFKDVVKAPVIRSILHLVYYMINKWFDSLKVTPFPWIITIFMNEVAGQLSQVFRKKTTSFSCKSKMHVMHKLGNKDPNLIFKSFLYWNIHSNVSANVKSATLYCEGRLLEDWRTITKMKQTLNDILHRYVCTKR